MTHLSEDSDLIGEGGEGAKGALPSDRAFAAAPSSQPEAVSPVPASIPSAVPYEDSPRHLYVMLTMVEGRPHIRKWSLDRPFAGATLYAHAGNGAPLGPHDSSEHVASEHLSMALRHVASNLWCECEPHVIEDMVRIVTDAASALETKAGQ